MAACWDGTYFYLTEKGGSKIHKINPSTGAEITTFSFSDTGPFLLGLTYFASTGYLYGNWNNEIRKIDKETGKVVSKGTITNFSTYNAFVGITNDGTYFWLLDMNSNNQDGRLHKFTITE
jgi:DNA-binding beta-propeller fold protein YncE